LLSVGPAVRAAGDATHGFPGMQSDILTRPLRRGRRTIAKYPLALS
jgi:hypothetical protein